MPVPSHSQVLPGSLVSVILKADQPTGRQVQGTVQDILSHNDHPHGVKVLLTDGREGRVQEILIAGNASQYQPQQQHTNVPDPQNWQAHTSYPSGTPSSHGQHQPVPDPQNWQAHTSFPRGHSPAYAEHPHSQHTDSRIPQAPSTTITANDAFDIPPEERSEQMEYLQSYEESKPASEDDRNQATLQKEFPNIDSSLIAAIYGDSKSLSATREMLQELKD